MSRPCDEGRCGRGGVGCVNYPERGSGGYRPNIHPLRLVGGRVSKFVTSSLAVASARSSPRMFLCALIFRRVVEKPFSRRFSRSCEIDALEEKHVVVVVWGCGETRSVVMEANSMEAGEGVREDTDPRVVLEFG